MIKKGRVKRPRYTRYIGYIKKRKLFFQYRTFWLAILALLIGGGFFYLICFSSFAQVENIEIRREEATTSPGISLISGEILEKAHVMTEKEVSKTILFWDARSIFLFNAQKVKQETLALFPEIEKMEIERRFFDNTLNIYLSRKKGVAQWCQEDKCFLVDKNGIVFDQVSEIDKELLKIQNLNTPEELVLGKEVIGSENLYQLLEIVPKIENLGLAIQEFEIDSKEKLNIVTKENWRIYLNPQERVEWQLTKLEVNLKEEIPPESRKNLEYIELRFGNFAPYKYKEF